MTAINYIDAAADAMVTHLQAAIDAAAGAGKVTVVRGWQDLATPKNSASTERARVAVSMGRPELFPCASRMVSRATVAATEDQAESWEVRYATATWTAAMQIDAFAMDRAGRDALARIIDAAMHPNVPSDSALTLDCDTYHGVQVRIVVDSEENRGDEVAAISGRWRRLIECNARGIKVALQTYGKASQLDIEADDLTGADPETTILVEPDP